MLLDNLRKLDLVAQARRGASLLVDAMRNSIAADNVSRIRDATPAMLRDLRAACVLETAYDDAIRFVGTNDDGTWIIEVVL